MRAGWAACVLAGLLGSSCHSGHPTPVPVITFARSHGTTVSELIVFESGEVAAWSQQPPARAKSTLTREELAELRKLATPDVACNRERPEPGALGREEIAYRMRLDSPSGKGCEGHWSSMSPLTPATRGLFARLEHRLAQLLPRTQR
jgi:hypothetical protein